MSNHDKFIVAIAKQFTEDGTTSLPLAEVTLDNGTRINAVDPKLVHTPEVVDLFARGEDVAVEATLNDGTRIKLAPAILLLEAAMFNSPSQMATVLKMGLSTNLVGMLFTGLLRAERLPSSIFRLLYSHLEAEVNDDVRYACAVFLMHKNREEDMAWMVPDNISKELVLTLARVLVSGRYLVDNRGNFRALNISINQRKRWLSWLAQKYQGNFSDLLIGNCIAHRSSVALRLVMSFGFRPNTTHLQQARKKKHKPVIQLIEQSLRSSDSGEKKH